MTINDLINRLEELKSTYGGNLLVGVEDTSRPFVIINHWIDKVEVYQETGPVEFNYCCIIMNDDSDIIDEYLNKRGKKLLPSKIVDL